MGSSFLIFCPTLKRCSSENTLYNIEGVVTRQESVDGGERGGTSTLIEKEADFWHGQWLHNPKKFIGAGILDPPPQGVTTQYIEKNVFGHATYQSKAHEKLYSNMSIKS